LLAARDYTEARLREKLAGKGFSETDAEETLARLLSEGWVNDRRFAERFADSAMASGRYYGSRLRQEMRRRGLSTDLVAEVLGSLMQEHDEDRDIQTVFQRRFSGFSFKTANDKEKRRAMGYLQRRGFGFSAIMKALKDSNH
jgi:regulatory protein